MGNTLNSFPFLKQGLTCILIQIHTYIWRHKHIIILHIGPGMRLWNVLISSLFLNRQKKEGASLVAQMVRISLQCGRADFDPWVGNNPWRRACNPFQYSCPENPHGQRSLTGYSPRRRKGLHWENFTNYYYMLTKVLFNCKVSHKGMAEINVTKYTTFLIFANLHAVWWTQTPMLHLSLFDLTTKATKQGSHSLNRGAPLWV